MDYENEPVVYTGPNIYPLALQRFQVFRERAIERIPEIEKLIVPVRELESTRRKIDKPGTNEARLFHAVQKAAGGIR